MNRISATAPTARSRAVADSKPPDAGGLPPAPPLKSPSGAAPTDTARWTRGTRERARLIEALEQELHSPVRACVWAFAGIHPAVLLTTSFVISQVLHEVLLFEIFAAYNRHGLDRTLFEVISPLTLWLLVDTLIQIGLTLCGRGHRILAQVDDGELIVFHRRLLAPRPDGIERRVSGSLALEPGLMGFAVDRIDTSAGRFYVWGRWRDMRLSVSMAGRPGSGAGPTTPSTAAPISRA